MYDKDSPRFWRDIRPGSTVTLSDEQSIADSMKRGEGVKGMDYIVESVLKIRQEDGLAEWLLLKLDDEEQDVYLAVKIVDNDFSLLIYFEPVEFPPGNRRDIVERGDTWIFQEPDNPDDFEYDELEFVSEIIWNVDVEEEGEVVEREITYRIKGQGVLYGSSTHDPTQAGLVRIMAAVVEYTADKDCANPELMLLELGGEHGEEGGLISMLVGCRINKTEVDVLKSRKEAPVERKKSSLWEKVLKKMSN